MTDNPAAPTTPATGPLRVIPLGGLGEFGMNMMVLELPGSAIVIDCGMMFPDASVMGVDAVISDMTYVKEIRDKVDAIFLTHGHEDHIGALPFLLETANVPVYGMKLTLGFVEDKLEEFDMRSRADLRVMEPRRAIESGDFVVEPIVVRHSEADMVFDEPMGSEPKVIKFTPAKTGTYPFSCTKKLLFFRSHEARGMKGSIEVIE